MKIDKYLHGTIKIRIYNTWGKRSRKLGASPHRLNYRQEENERKSIPPFILAIRWSKDGLYGTWNQGASSCTCWDAQKWCQAALSHQKKCVFGNSWAVFNTKAQRPHAAFSLITPAGPRHSVEWHRSTRWHTWGLEVRLIWPNQESMTSVSLQSHFVIPRGERSEIFWLSHAPLSTTTASFTLTSCARSQSLSDDRVLSEYDCNPHPSACVEGKPAIIL